MMSNSLPSALPADGDMALAVAQTSHIGGRQTNQDALGMAEQDGLACYVVSDGAGGHRGGEVAARIVVQAVTDSFLQDLSFGSRALQSYIDAAVARVAHAKSTDGALVDMSATVAAVLIDLKNRRLLSAHLGDSRVYLFHAGKISCVTKDHSVVQQFIDAGYCKPEEVRTHPQRSVLFAAIGAEGDTLPAVSGDMTIVDGDAVLICSDGLWEWVMEAEMEQALADAKDVDEWLNRMKKQADARSCASAKTRDNFSAFALWLGKSAARGSTTDAAPTGPR